MEPQVRKEDCPLDYSRFDLEKLHALYVELDLEMDCIYARNSAQMRRLKKSGEWEPEMMQEFKDMIQREVNAKTQKILSDKGISSTQLTMWIEQFAPRFPLWTDGTEFIQRQRAKYEKINKDLFEGRLIEPFTYPG